MAASYPGAVKSWTPLVDGDTSAAAQVNTLYEEVTALQTELGTDPAGSTTDLKTRLLKSISAAGFIQFATPTTLTISSGSITATQNRHYIDTESAAASDNLDTITAMGDQWLLVLSIASDDRDVTIRHNVGNILCTSGNSITLGTAADLVILIYDDAVDKWLAFGSSAGAMTNQANSWTAKQTFSSGMAVAVSTITATATLDNTYRVVRCNAASGAITVNLPAAATCTGTVYDIKKVDSTANTVTIDANGAETIDGATTKVLTNQYSSYSIVSNGTSWDIL